MHKEPNKAQYAQDTNNDAFVKVVRDFKTITRNDTALAGGKGASLGEMTNAGINVPPGFVVLAPAFERFLEETDLNVEIDSILHKVDHREIHTVERASEEIQALILGEEMPKDIAAAIQAEFKKLGAKFVAVRSSATAEDSSAAAWAGQLDSFLNTTEGNLLQNVQKCWASLFTPRAIFYRFEKDLHKTRISVAVVVQKMVESEVSGIAFSVHPVTEDRNQLIIEAGFGLGEAIVSGQITPDSYVIEKNPRRIIDKNISVQKRGLFRRYSDVLKNIRITAEGGTGNEWTEIKNNKGSRQKLSDEQILELSELILNIESHHGFPCDIEWALARSEHGRGEKCKFYIVQSRPITTLAVRTGAPFARRTISYERVITRDAPLVAVELWAAAFQWLTHLTGTWWPPPIFIYSHGVVESWRPKEVFFSVLPHKLAEWFTEKTNKEKAWELLAQHNAFAKKLTVIKKRKNALSLTATSRFFSGNRDSVKALGTLILIYWTVEWSQQLTFVSFPADFITAEKLIRKETSVFDDIIDVYYRALHTEEVRNPDLDGLASFLSASELQTFKNNAERHVMSAKSRSSGYAYVDGKTVLIDALPLLLKEKGYFLRQQELPFAGNELKGQGAVKGKCTGKVKILRNRTELTKIKKGDVLVAPMTTPWYLPAMKKASAFITDEGGITCHASIMAREMKKPCIIGTKIATQVLKDGDLVEVDAQRGIVRILKKA